MRNRPLVAMKAAGSAPPPPYQPEPRSRVLAVSIWSEPPLSAPERQQAAARFERAAGIVERPARGVHQARADDPAGIAGGRAAAELNGAAGVVDHAGELQRSAGRPDGAEIVDGAADDQSARGRLDGAARLVRDAEHAVADGAAAADGVVHVDQHIAGARGHDGRTAARYVERTAAR
jgi:hypothetical protein